jgi:GH24 family phage-related lysozyme (muramidase)
MVLFYAWSMMMLSAEGKLKLKSLLVDHEKYIDFEEDCLYFYNKLNNFLQFFHKLDENRQIALIHTCFMIGIQGLLHSKEIINFLQKHDYAKAAKAITKVSDAIVVSANIIKTGEI